MKHHTPSFTLLFAIILAFGLMSGCTQSQDMSSIDSTLQIAATFYPFYDLTRAIAGDAASVYSVVPPTTEPHAFEPSPQDIARLQQVNLFVATGLEFEAFEEKLVQSLPQDTPVIAASEGIVLLEGEEHSHDEHEEEYEEHEEEQDHAGTDPHVWLSPANTQIIAQNIAQGLIVHDPEHASVYEANAQKLLTQLQELDALYAQSLSTCAKDAIIVTHNAYQYLARDYGFEVISISGLSPESEPTPRQMQELVEEAQLHNISAVFFEELVDPRVAGSIAREIGARTFTINPVAGSVEGKSYMQIMHDNLQELIAGLECT